MHTRPRAMVIMRHGSFLVYPFAYRLGGYHDSPPNLYHGKLSTFDQTLYRPR